jgi:hypothetical protein
LKVLSSKFTNRSQIIKLIIVSSPILLHVKSRPQIKLRFFMWVLILSFVSAVFCTINVTRCPNDLKPNGDWSSTTFLQHFYLAEVRPLQPAKQQTRVHMCSTDTHLMLRFDCIDDNPYSPYSQCNEHLYNAAVVEAFITGTRSDPSKVDLHHYLELEVSPNSVLFASHITNPALDCPGITGTLIPCNGGQIAWEAHKNEEDKTWWAFLKISWSLINSGNTGDVGAGPTYFKANFFRIDTPLSHPKEYSAWQSPLSKSVPCFHAPTAFEEFALNSQ